MKKQGHVLLVVLVTGGKPHLKVGAMSKGAKQLR